MILSIVLVTAVLVPIFLMLNNTIFTQYDTFVQYVAWLGREIETLTEEQKEIFLTAFVHKSYASDFVPALDHNERLEFLGDSVLWAVIGSLLYTQYPSWSEAQMTLYKIALVREEMLATVARDIDLGSHLILSKGENNQWWSDKDAILSDGLEALIGTWYLIAWFTSVQQFITTYLRPHLEILKRTDCKSYKSLIQERAQWHGYDLPTYTTNEIKSSWEPLFESTIQIGDTITATGRWKNKKKAQELAAEHCYHIVMEK